MKKIFLVVLIALVSSVTLTACVETDTTTTTMDLTTRNTIYDLIDQEYASLALQFPTQIDSDTILPEPSSSAFSVKYSVEGVILENQVLSFVKLAYDKTIVLSIELSYQGLYNQYEYEILQIRDEELYSIEQTNQIFDLSFSEVIDAIPYQIYSDFTLPSIDIDGVEVEYQSDDILIYRNRLVFPFPEEMEIVYVNVDVTYNRETRSTTIPVRLSSFDQLPRIPEIHITTTGQAEIDSNDLYTDGTLDLIEFDSMLNPTMTLDAKDMGIRLRGNSTLYMPKKSYKIKFDSKTAMFSDYKEKDWVLLANFADQTLIRTYLAFDFASELQMEFSPSTVFVDLYINDVYQGNYMLTDQVEVTNDRVDVEEHSTELDTGYLLEWDAKIYDTSIDHSDENYFFIYGIPFVIKSPDWEDPEYSIDQLYFIEDYMLTVYLTLRDGLDYSNLIDESTFIDWFIVNELFKNVDSGYSSIYYYKDEGGLLKMGPVWDFDLSTGNPGHLQEDLRVPEGWYTSRNDKNILFYYLMEYPEFRQHLKARWNEIYESKVVPLLGKIHAMTDSMSRSIYLNFQVWDVIGSFSDWYTAPEILAMKTYYEQVWYLYDYLEIRMEWLNTNINQL